MIRREELSLAVGASEDGGRQHDRGDRSGLLPQPMDDHPYEYPRTDRIVGKAEMDDA